MIQHAILNLLKISMIYYNYLYSIKSYILFWCKYKNTFRNI